MTRNRKDPRRSLSRRRAVALIAGMAALAIVVFLIGLALILWLDGVKGDYASNAIATIVGVVIGVPIAFYVATYQDRLAQRTKIRADKVDRRQLLELLRSDLEECLEELQGPDRQPRAEAVVPFLRVDVWRAVSDGGQTFLDRGRTPAQRHRKGVPPD